MVFYALFFGLSRIILYCSTLFYIIGFMVYWFYDTWYIGYVKVSLVRKLKTEYLCNVRARTRAQIVLM